MIDNLPQIPSCKFSFNNNEPLELFVLRKLLNGQTINEADETILKEALAFYKELYSFLKRVNLSELTDEDARQLKDYTINATQLIVTPNLPEITFKSLFRVSIVKDKFLETGKVRDLEHVIHPSKDIVKENGFYGRANTNESTVFYCSFQPNVAILETRPRVGERIILAEWNKIDTKPFIPCPVISSEELDSGYLKKIKTAYEEIKLKQHPLMNEIIDAYFNFFSSEILKNVEIKSPKRYEYFFSALFSDLALEQTTKWKKNGEKIDCLLYPSVANNHRRENLAIIPDSVSRLIPVKLTDYIVTETMYENPVVSVDDLPVKLSEIRAASRFEGNRILWEDD